MHGLSGVKVGADNWQPCPQCLYWARQKASVEQNAVMELYGEVPVEDFDARRAALPSVDPDDFYTFREDYEFWGAETGEVQVSYRGACNVCGLSATIETSNRFWEAPA